MRNKLDNFLLATLWLLASTLGVCFWFNIRFGFNIFSSQHWHHLAYMQASQNPVSPTFYISMVISVIVVIFGLYLLVRPKYRRIKKTIYHTHTPPMPRPNTTPPVASTTQTTSPQTQTQPAPDSTTEKAPYSEPALTRPPRLNISVTPKLTGTPTPQPNTHPTPTNDFPELREIFESAGYTTKPAPRIGPLQTALLAIGGNEVLWIGAVGVPTSALQSAIETLNQVFSDTLDDIIINVNGFVVNAPDASEPGAPNILTFDTYELLEQYITNHPNPPLSSEDIENFDAYSSYISTVINYIGKI